VRENVNIAYRGANYEIGQGPQGYGIWTAGAQQAQPWEWWPATPQGWSAAWSRFAAIEAPGTIVPVTEPAAVAAPAAGGRNQVIGGALLAIGVVLGIAGLFPGYLGGASLASATANLVPHVIYLVAWALAATLIMLGGTRARVGALLGLGASIVTLGLYFADVGTAMAAGASVVGAGFVLAMIGWLACAAGSGVAVGRWPADWPSRPAGRPLTLGALLVTVSVGIAITFAPSWDSYLLRDPAGLSQTVTLGNAFSNPAPVIVGDVATMLAVVAVIVAAVLWRQARLGVVLAAGALVPMVAQAVSAIIGVTETTSPAQLGISPSAAAAAGLTISNGLTPVFWIFCAFVIAAIIACAALATSPEPVGMVSAATVLAATGQAGPTAPAATVPAATGQPQAASMPSADTAPANTAPADTAQAAGPAEVTPEGNAGPVQPGPGPDGPDTVTF
jgi:hypothetical protein